jgi:predicted GNAT family acetyltransferase
MDIQRDEHGKKGAFFIDENGEWVAELTYFRSGGNQITVDHTEVDPKLRGKGVGEQLVKAAVEYARESDLKINPACPYTKKVIDETPEFQDVVA